MELMQKVEERRKGLAGLEQQEQAEAQRLEEIQSQAQATQRSLAGALGDLKKRRDAAERGIDGETLDLFNRVSERYEGEAMAKVVRVHPRRDEFICDGCNMSLTAERANALMTRDEVLTCRNCGRILFLEKS
jgi:predicted  nucleic acid-binding Zn-ribbon protein